MQEPRGRRTQVGDKKQDVPECPGAVYEHDIATGQSGEALVVAVLVQLTDLGTARGRVVQVTV